MATSYGIVERKLFSIPKLALFPAIASSHPYLTAIALPVALSIDAAKSKVMAEITLRVERLNQKYRKISSVRRSATHYLLLLPYVAQPSRVARCPQSAGVLLTTCILPTTYYLLLLLTTHVLLLLHAPQPSRVA